MKEGDGQGAVTEGPDELWALNKRNTIILLFFCDKIYLTRNLPL